MNFNLISVAVSGFCCAELHLFSPCEQYSPIVVIVAVVFVVVNKETIFITIGQFFISSEIGGAFFSRHFVERKTGIAMHFLR